VYNKIDRISGGGNKQMISVEELKERLKESGTRIEALRRYL